MKRFGCPGFPVARANSAQSQFDSANPGPVEDGGLGGLEAHYGP